MRTVFLALLVMAMSATGCQEENQEQTGPTRAVPVAVVAVESRDMREIVRGIGTLEAPEDVQVGAEAPGRVTGVHFEAGQQVAAGDLLYTLESAPVQRRIEARQAALAEARAELENARRVYQRRRELLAGGFIAEETRDEARTAVATARARVERLRSEVESLREQFKDTRVLAPVAGRTGEQLVDVGDFVDTGQIMVMLVGTRQPQVAFTVPERYAGRLARGQKVEVRVAARPERRFTGEVFFVSPAIDPAARDLLLKARIDNSDHALRPGGFASVELILEVREDVLVVPEEALVPTRSGYQVFVVEEGKARRREVTVGLRRPGIAEVRGDLAAGDRVIRSGHIDVADGDPVRPVEGERGSRESR